MYIEEAGMDFESTGTGVDIDTVDPRAMGEHFTTESADSLLGVAMRVFGITFDEMSEVSIYQVYIAPPRETEDGFLDISKDWDFALKAEQSAWAGLYTLEGEWETGEESVASYCIEGMEPRTALYWERCFFTTSSSSYI